MCVRVTGFACVSTIFLLNWFDSVVLSGFHVNSFIVIQNDHKVHDLFDCKHTFSDQTTNMISTVMSD